MAGCEPCLGLARLHREQAMSAVSSSERSTAKLKAAGIRVLDLNAPAARYSDFRGDGLIERHGERLRWTVPETGGRLRAARAPPAPGAPEGR